jgi:hypothetical protein
MASSEVGARTELRVLDGAREEEVVCGLVAHGDAQALAIHVLDRAHGRVGADHVRALDLDVGRRECDLVRPLRIVGEECHVDPALLHLIGDLAGGVELQIFDACAQSPRELARELGPDAARRAAGGVALGDHGIAVVDRGAQDAPGRHLGADVFGHGRSHGAGGKKEYAGDGRENGAQSRGGHQHRRILTET